MHPFVAARAFRAVAPYQGRGVAMPYMRVGEQPMMVKLGGPGARAATREYADRVNTSVMGLGKEIDNEIVSEETPEQLEEEADLMSKQAALPGISTLVSVRREKAKHLRKVNAGKTPDQIKMRQSFYSSWRTYLAAWEKFYETLQSFSLTGASPSSTWDQIESYETQLRSYRDEFTQVTGVAPVTPAPPTATQVAEQHTPPPEPSPITDTLQTAMKAAAFVGVAALGVYAVLHSGK
ncbi:MAG: hypothetical protein ACHREM_15100 [Polyangiales bacterium]